MIRTGRAAILLDKDGTLVDHVPYNVDPERITLAPGAREALEAFADAGYVVAVVSNQPGVAHGRFTEAALEPVARRLEELCAAAGAPLAGFFYCPHHPDASVPRYRLQCSCRKPASGLLLTAARKLELDLPRSWMIGDTLDDIEAGRRAGCRAVLVDNGGETEWRPGSQRTPDAIVADLAAAARAVLGGPVERGA